MTEPSSRWHALWVVLAAFLGPLLLGIAFLTVMAWSNSPAPAHTRPEPNAGLYQSSLNDAFTFMHVIAQMAFVVIGALWLRGSRARAAFLWITIPFSMLVCLLTFVGLIAK